MLSKIILEEKVGEVRHLIENAENIVIVSHISPDGDAVGSSLGMAHFLKKIGKNPTIVLPNKFPAFFNWLSGTEKIVIYENEKEKAETIFAASDLVFCLDFNLLDRINGVAQLVRKSTAKKVLVDHHIAPDTFCDVIISHPDLASTSELVFRLICRLGHAPEITKECAEAIYTGMMTDTGNFSYNSMQPEMYQIVAELLQKGINKDAIYNNVYNHYSANRMRMMGYCLNRKMRIYPKYKTAVIVLSREECERFDFQVGDTEGFVNLPLAIENVDISVFVREDERKIKLSFRSQGDFPVNKMAACFQGGGHRNAAGGESYIGMRSTLVKLERVIKRRAEFEENND